MSRAYAGTNRCSIGRCSFAFELDIDGVRGDVHEIQVHEDWEMSQVIVQVRRHFARWLRHVRELEVLAPTGSGEWRLLLPYNTVHNELHADAQWVGPLTCLVRPKQKARARQRCAFDRRSVTPAAIIAALADSVEDDEYASSEEGSGAERAAAEVAHSRLSDAEMRAELADTTFDDFLCVQRAGRIKQRDGTYGFAGSNSFVLDAAVRDQPQLGFVCLKAIFVDSGTETNALGAAGSAAANEGRFTEEGGILGEHSGILAVLHRFTAPIPTGIDGDDFGSAIKRNQTVWLVTRRLDDSLGEWLRKLSAPLPEWGVLSFARQLASVLAHLKARGVAHRDVKLDNVLVSGEGPAPRLVLCDFGCARVCAASTGVLDWSVAYQDATMKPPGASCTWAPEILDEIARVARSPDATARLSYEHSDAFAVGLILHTVARAGAGEREALPFGRSIVFENVEDESSYLEPPHPDLSDATRDIVRSLLRIDPDERARPREVMRAVDAARVAALLALSDASVEAGEETKATGLAFAVKATLAAERAAHAAALHEQCQAIASDRIVERKQHVAELRARDECIAELKRSHASALEHVAARTQLVDGLRARDERVAELERSLVVALETIEAQAKTIAEEHAFFTECKEVLTPGAATPARAQRTPSILASPAVPTPAATPGATPRAKRTASILAPPSASTPATVPITTPASAARRAIPAPKPGAPLSEGRASSTPVGRSKRRLKRVPSVFAADFKGTPPPSERSTHDIPAEKRKLRVDAFGEASAYGGLMGNWDLVTERHIALGWVYSEKDAHGREWWLYRAATGDALGRWLFAPRDDVEAAQRSGSANPWKLRSTSATDVWPIALQFEAKDQPAPFDRHDFSVCSHAATGSAPKPEVDHWASFNSENATGGAGTNTNTQKKSVGRGRKLSIGGTPGRGTPGRGTPGRGTPATAGGKRSL